MAPTEPMPLTLILRHGCHLCEEMESLLFELLEPNSFSLEYVDVDADEALKHRYNELVPVLLHHNVEICHHFLDLDAVRRALAGYNTALNCQLSQTP